MECAAGAYDLPMASSQGRTVAAVPLLETKLYIPKWRPGLVSRPRLIERLDRGTERTLTLVSAPAGFGKTTLLAEWLAATPARNRPAAWVSLDPTDNDPALFWAYALTALGKVWSGVGEGAQSLLRSPQPPPIASILTALINDLSAIEGNVALVLDDLHVIDTQPVHGGIAFLVDHLPPQLHLVIASRADPPLPLARLRGRGELTELRASDLRFSTDEAAAFFIEMMGSPLAADDVAALETRTEGWIAGLQSAALSMQGRADVEGFIRAFAGDDRYIVGYLVEEVLQRQPERIRSFLLQTSILDRLSGPLCDAVTARDDGKVVLEALERDNLFSVPLDDKRHWYRYHHLFADVLRAHLVEELPDRLPVLHRRAAAWFEARGMAAEAIEHAHNAGDHQTVARLLVANVEEFQRIGRYASITRWASSLPDGFVRQRPRLALIHAAAALAIESNLEAARRLTSWAEAAIAVIEQDGGFEASNDVDGTVIGPEGLDALNGEALALRLAHSARHLPSAEVTAIARRSLALLPPGKVRLRGMVRLIDAGAGNPTELSDLGSALADLEAGVEEARRAQDPMLLASMLSHRGQMGVALGRLDEGLRSFEEALAVGQRASPEAGWVMCGPHAWLAEVLLERGDLAGAIVHAAEAIKFAAKSPTRSYVLYGRTAAAQVLLAAGDAGAAHAQLAEAQQFARGTTRFRYASFLSSVELAFYCRTGDLDAAAAVARNRGLSPNLEIDHANEEEMTAYARFLITRGDGHDAGRVLSRVLLAARAGGRVRHEIHALALQALAYERLGKRSLALASLGRATMLGEPGRFCRTFTGEGPVATGLVAVLADAVGRGRGPAETGSSSYLASLLRGAGIAPEPPSPRPAAADLAEPLTAREIEVLRLIAAGLRNQEIADRLFVSLPTVKRHVANAYAKLGVGHRTEAIARANALDLL